MSKKRHPIYVGGFVMPGFEKVQERFCLNLEEDVERGGTFAAYYRGELVVNLWGGSADLQARVPWSEHHLACFFSGTKVLCAVVIAHLVDRHLLCYSEKVQHYWPEFSQNGKGDITLGQLISHQAGLPALDDNFSLSLIKEDPAKLADLLAKQKPLWKIGTGLGYHPVTFSLYLDEIVRRVDPRGRDIAQYFREEIAKPFGLELYIGLPKELFHRAPRVHILKLSDQKEFVKNFKGDLKILKKIYQQPTDFRTVLRINDPNICCLPVGSSLGYGTAEAMAKIHGILAMGGVYKGTRLLSEDVIQGFEEIAVAGVDKAYGSELMLSLGSTVFIATEGTRVMKMFGYSGFGGQMVMADRHYKVGFAYATSHLDTSSREGPQADRRWSSLYEALYECVHKIENVHETRKTFYNYENYKQFTKSNL